MQADGRFTNLEPEFWAHVRTIGQTIGYTDRKTRQIRIYSASQIGDALHAIGLTKDHIVDAAGRPSDLARLLVGYFAYRADVLNRYVEPRLMDAEEAAALYLEVRGDLAWRTPVAMNKQKGEKRAPAFLTGLVNMLVEANLGEYPFDPDPRELATVTRGGRPVRTLARRVDGAFPSPKNPIALWEVKEYYYTTTFGSRVADGIYETLLDGLELQELERVAGVRMHHMLAVDSHYTWWISGKSYLCRLIDMLNQGYVDEILFGREVVERLPTVVAAWVHEQRQLEERNGLLRS